MSLGQGFKFFRRNFTDITRTEIAEAVATIDNNSANLDLMLNRNEFDRWESIGANDDQISVTFDVDFNADRNLTDFFLIDTNLTSFELQRFDVGMAKFVTFFNENKNFFMNFNGTDEYINAPDDATLDIADDLTASVWINGSSGSSQSILGKYDRDSQRSWLITTASSTKARIIISDDGLGGPPLSSNLKDFTTSIDVLDNTWHHIAFTFASGTLRIFVDGVEDTSVIKTSDGPITTIFSSTSDLNVGALTNIGVAEQFFGGGIDEASIWDTTVLTPTEIAEIYNNGEPTDLSQHSQAGNLVSWWQMGDRDVPPTITDRIGTNDGTMNNMDATNIAASPIGAQGNQDNFFTASFTGITTEQFKLIMYKTQTPDEEKRINELIITELIGQFEFRPFAQPRHDGNVVENKMINGRSKFVYNLVQHNFNLTLTSHTSIPDRQLIQTLVDLNDSFIFWPSGGDETQFSFADEGYRLEDIFLVSMANFPSPFYTKNYYKAGTNLQILLKEVS